MKLSHIFKIVVPILVVWTIVCIFTGCSGKSNTDVSQVEETSKLSEIKTGLGTLYIPKKYEKLMQTTINDGDNSCTIDFFSVLDGKQYDLFEISIGEEKGQYVGTITGKRGDSHNVFVEVYDLGDISGLPQDKSDQLYAMQEAVNTVVENLK